MSDTNKLTPTELALSRRDFATAAVASAAGLTLAAGPVRADTRQENNKAVVGRWFTNFWGKDVNLAVVDEIAAPDMLLKYSLHKPRLGRSDIKAFMTDFRRAFPSAACLHRPAARCTLPEPRY
jgi:hypothetical protein